MPLTHIIVDGVELTPEDALAQAAERPEGQKYPYELLKAMLATQQERDYISTTLLTSKCLRSTVLKRQVDYSEEVDRMWAAFRGTMFHGQLEKNVHPDCIEEARFFVELEGLGILSGSPDLVDPVRGILYDWKFTKENPRFDRPWPDHVLQVQINRWLVDHAYAVTWRGIEYDLTAKRNIKKFRPVDWQDLILVYMDDRGPKPLRVMKSIDIPKVSGEGTKKARVSDVWDDETVEAIILERYAASLEALESGTVPEVPAGWEEAAHPLCGFCPVRKECLALQHHEECA